LPPGISPARPTSWPKSTRWPLLRWHQL
jgi:hypothetical protein